MSIARRERVDAWSRRNLGRPITHLTPSYVKARTLEGLHRRRHPTDPWLTSDAVAILDSLLRTSDRGVEFGSGRSTTWLAGRLASLVSVEHSRQWAEIVTRSLDDAGRMNVSLQLVEPGEEATEPKAAEYLAAVADLAPASMDIALVDGLHRSECLVRSIELVRPGGVIVLDNAERYFPSSSRSPQATRVPLSRDWADLHDRMSRWRGIWTSNGVYDTGLWFKPCLRDPAAFS